MGFSLAGQPGDSIVDSRGQQGTAEWTAGDSRGQQRPQGASQCLPFSQFLELPLAHLLCAPGPQVLPEVCGLWYRAGSTAPPPRPAFGQSSATFLSRTLSFAQFPWERNPLWKKTRIWKPRGVFTSLRGRSLSSAPPFVWGSVGWEGLRECAELGGQGEGTQEQGKAPPQSTEGRARASAAGCPPEVILGHCMQRAPRPSTGSARLRPGPRSSGQAPDCLGREAHGGAPGPEQQLPDRPRGRGACRRPGALSSGVEVEGALRGQAD